MKQLVLMMFCGLFALFGFAAPPLEATELELGSTIGAPPYKNAHTPFVVAAVKSETETSDTLKETGVYLDTDKAAKIQSGVNQATAQNLTEPAVLKRPSKGIANHTAEIRQINGLYIYLYSTPIDETEFIGAVISPPIVISTDMDKMVQLMAKRAKAKFPDAEAIIFSNDDLGKCDAVKFK